MLTDVSLFFRPYRSLYLADMCFAEEEHAEAALADAAADGLREAAVEQHLMELQGSTFGASAFLQLPAQGFLVDTDTHG